MKSVDSANFSLRVYDYLLDFVSHVWLNVGNDTDPYNLFYLVNKQTNLRNNKISLRLFGIHDDNHELWTALHAGTAVCFDEIVLYGMSSLVPRL